MDDPPAARILVASRRRLIADALAELLASQPGVGSCEVAADLSELSARLASRAPSAFMVDLDDLPSDTTGLAGLLDEWPGARRVGIYDEFTSPTAQLAFDLGLTVLVPLSSPLERIVYSVVGDRLQSSATPAVGLTPAELARLRTLTPREIDVLNHIARGRAVPTIAGILGITEHTVETHKRRCFAKLGVQQQSHAVALAAGAGMITAT